MEKNSNLEKIENDGLNRLVTFLAEYGNWPITMEKWSQNNFDWQTLSTDSIRRLSVLSLMDVYVGLDRLNSSQSVILVSKNIVHIDRFLRDVIPEI